VLFLYVDTKTHSIRFLLFCTKKISSSRFALIGLRLLPPDWLIRTLYPLLSSLHHKVKHVTETNMAVNFFDSAMNSKLFVFLYILPSQSTYIHREVQCLVPSSELGPPYPSPASSCVPPGSKTEGTHSPAVEGVEGGFLFGRLKKKPSTVSTL
jgi:hypothetical protein